MFSHAGSQAETPNHFPRCALEMGSVQSYNMKIDVAAVLPACLSQWVTPGPSFHFIYSVTPLSSRARSHAPPPPPPSRLFTLRPPVLHSLHRLQPQTPDLLPLLPKERGLCLPPAAFTWRHEGGDSETGDDPALSAPPSLASMHVRGRDRVHVCKVRKFLRPCFFPS